MRSVCFDTNVVIWGIKQEASGTQHEMIDRAKELIRQLRANKVTMVIPSIVVAEALVRVKASEHPAFLEQMHRGFVVSPFDVGAAGKFAHLWAQYKDHPLVVEAAQNHERTRAMMKADCMIIATAMVTKSEAIYTHNTKDFVRFSVPGIKILNIPEIPLPQPQAIQGKLI